MSAINLRVLGCHGGTSSEHRCVSFLIDDRIAMDAGSVASALTLEEQSRIDTVLITHSHLDHISDLGTLCDVRSLQDGASPVVAGVKETIEALRTHFFNDVLWPDFSRIEGKNGPVLVYRELEPEVAASVSGMTVLPVMVDHSVPSCGFLIGNGTYSIAYSGDTGPTDRFWQVVNETGEVRALITEVSFPNDMDELARTSGHLTPAMLAEQLAKLDRQPEGGVLIYGLKPVFARQIGAELSSMIETGEIELLQASTSFRF